MSSPQETAAIDETSIRYEGWPVVGVCFLVAAVAWGLGFYGQGVYLAELQRVHGWAASSISTAATCYYLFSSMLVVFVSEGIRKLGPRLFLAAGVTCIAAGIIAISQVTAIWQLYLAYVLLAFGWVGTSLAAINNTLGMWFTKRRGMAISLALNGASIGGVLGVPLMVAVIGRIGFASTLVGAAIIVVVVTIPIIFLAIGKSPQHAASAPVVSDITPPTVTSASQIRGQVFRSMPFWTITVPFSMALLAQVGFIVHQISYLDPLIGRERASFAVSLMTAMAAVGRLVIGAVIDRLDQRKVSAVSFASQALALLVLINTRNEYVMYACCALFGFSVGNAITLPSLIVQREFSTAAFGVLVSLVIAICQFTYAFGPGIIGLIRDFTGSYTLPFYLCMVFEVSAAALVLVRGREADAQSV